MFVRETPSSVAWHKCEVILYMYNAESKRNSFVIKVIVSKCLGMIKSKSS